MLPCGLLSTQPRNVGAQLIMRNRTAVAATGAGARQNIRNRLPGQPPRAQSLELIEVLREHPVKGDMLSGNGEVVGETLRPSFDLFVCHNQKSLFGPENFMQSTARRRLRFRRAVNAQYTFLPTDNETTNSA